MLPGLKERYDEPFSRRATTYAADGGDGSCRTTGSRRIQSDPSTLAVLKAITALPGAFSVQEIEQWLVERNESPGIASIFRTIRLLCDLGMLQRIHGLDDCHRYCLGSGHAHHLVCTRCGVIERFDNCGLQGVISTLEQATGYRITNHVVELFGLCPQCLATSA